MVKFNLLPSTTADKNADARQRNLAGLAVIAVVAVLSGLFITQAARVSSAEQDLQDAQNVLASLNQEVAQLRPYAELRNARQDFATIASIALGDEVSAAQALNDVAAALPDTSWMQTYTFSREAQETRPLGAEEFTVGRVTVTGVDIDRVSPGVRNYIERLNDVDGLTNVFLNSANRLDEDTFEDGNGNEQQFSVEVDVTTERYTENFVDGFPASLQPIVDELVETGVYDGIVTITLPDPVEGRDDDSGDSDDNDEGDESNGNGDADGDSGDDN